MKKVITITTDFGDSFATAQLHAVIADLGFDGKVIDNHSVTAFSVIEGAFEILIIARYSPQGTVHVGVIDPGVGGRRKGIVIKTKKSWYVGPDNGLFYPAAQQEGIKEVWHIQEDKIGGLVSNTFHGRDVFIKAGVYIALGKQPDEFGAIAMSKDELQILSFQEGQVLHIDNYGNIKIYWSTPLVVGSHLQIAHQGKTIDIPVVKTFSDVAEGVLLALLGSSGTLELAINLGNIARFFGVALGEVLPLKSSSGVRDSVS